MRKITVGQMKEVLGAELLIGSSEDYISGVSIDSRQVKQEDAFFAIIGENHDAHTFLPQVFSSGCKVAVVSDRQAALAAAKGEGISLLCVTDTVAALQQLAKWYISLFDLKKIAVTGSVGKTSTRDIAYAVMSTCYKTIKPQNNFNNEIGLPLTAFLIEEDTEAAVFELGMETLGEVHLLADIVKPQIAIITNVGLSHIETLGSREAILQAKLEITDFLRPEDCLIICDSADLLNRESAAGKYKLITVGRDGKSDFILSAICNQGEKGVQFTIEHNCKAQRIKLPMPGEHNIYNAALAISAAFQTGVSLEKAAEGTENIKLTDKRLAIKGGHGIKVIDDTYNASPDSMKSGISALMSVAGVRKVAILGDMFGLGDDSEKYHREIGTFAAGKGIDLLVTIGNYARYISENAAKEKDDFVLHFANKEEFFQVIDKVIQTGDVVLVKGSRGMRMEQIVNKILE